MVLEEKDLTFEQIDRSWGGTSKERAICHGLKSRLNSNCDVSTNWLQNRPYFGFQTLWLRWAFFSIGLQNMMTPLAFGQLYINYYSALQCVLPSFINLCCLLSTSVNLVYLCSTLTMLSQLLLASISFCQLLSTSVKFYLFLSIYIKEITLSPKWI